MNIIEYFTHIFHFHSWT